MIYDIILIEDSELEFLKVKQFLDHKFTIKDLKQVKYFLGLELVRSETEIYVNQRKYVLDLLDDTSLVGCKPASTPLPKGTRFCNNQGELLSDPQQTKG